MEVQDYISDVILLVDSRSLSDEEYTQAVIDQAKIMAGEYYERSTKFPLSNPYEPLEF
jgi:hypothetical protein